MFGYSSRQIKYNVQTKQFEYISVLGLPLHINRFTRNRLPNQISAASMLNLSLDQRM